MCRAVHRVDLLDERMRRVGEDASAFFGIVAVKPYDERSRQCLAATLEQQRKSMHPRLWPEVPRRRYHCFYPMDKKRSDKDNWYSLPIGKRRDLMREHGMIGRKYAGTVNQIISGSIGFDNWEWGVDLFADDTLVFKKLIYEMRFDHVSAVYALFGQFFVGVRCPAVSLELLLNGALPM